MNEGSFTKRIYNGTFWVLKEKPWICILIKLFLIFNNSFLENNTFNNLFASKKFLY